MHFEVEHRDPQSSARAGRLQTDHGEIHTPMFMPVGTAGTVKAVEQRELEGPDINAPVILGNTYHLFLRPGLKVLENAGGLHKFIGWNRNLLTDSGGYQVFSLGERRKITEEGVTFASHIDGTRHLFSPENVMDTQRIIGADFIMAFDECTPYPCEEQYARDSMHLTHRWLDRCIKRFDETEPKYGHEQTLLPIVQGSVYPDLRKESAEFIASRGRPANAIGGLSVGEPKDDMYGMTDLVCQILPKDKPRYLMGVGTPEDLLECIALGIDMFDCVMPTRHARTAMVFTTEGTLNLRNEQWHDDHSPLDPNLGSYASGFSKAYLRHLTIAKEMLGAQLASIQNLALYLWLVREARARILDGTFATWKGPMIARLMQRL